MILLDIDALIVGFSGLLQVIGHGVSFQTRTPSNRRALLVEHLEVVVDDEDAPARQSPSHGAPWLKTGTACRYRARLSVVENTIVVRTGFAREDALARGARREA